jgi:hypothetical protein
MAQHIFVSSLLIVFFVVVASGTLQFVAGQDFDPFGLRSYGKWTGNDYSLRTSDGKTCSAKEISAKIYIRMFNKTPQSMDLSVTVSSAAKGRTILQHELRDCTWTLGPFPSVLSRCKDQATGKMHCLAWGVSGERAIRFVMQHAPDTECFNVTATRLDAIKTTCNVSSDVGTGVPEFTNLIGTIWSLYEERDYITELIVQAALFYVGIAAGVAAGVALLCCMTISCVVFTIKAVLFKNYSVCGVDLAQYCCCCGSHTRRFGPFVLREPRFGSLTQ